MNPSLTSEKIDKGKSITALRRMGMSLSVLGAVMFSTGMVVCWKNGEGIPDARNILLLISGITMFIAGLYIWRIAKQTDSPK